MIVLAAFCLGAFMGGLGAAFAWTRADTSSVRRGGMIDLTGMRRR